MFGFSSFKKKLQKGNAKRVEQVFFTNNQSLFHMTGKRKKNHYLSIMTNNGWADHQTPKILTPTPKILTPTTPKILTFISGSKSNRLSLNIRRNFRKTELGNRNPEHTNLYLYVEYLTKFTFFKR